MAASKFSTKVSVAAKATLARRRDGSRPSWAELRAFYRLVDAEALGACIKPVAKLVRPGSPEALTGTRGLEVDITRLAVHHRKIVAHPVFAWLHRDANFKNAYKGFGKHARRLVTKRDYWLLTSRFAAYRLLQYGFLSIVAPSFWHYGVREIHGHPAQATATDYKDTLRETRRFRRLVMSRLRFEDPSDERTFRKQMAILETHLDANARAGAQPRNDAWVAQRQFVISIAQALKRATGEPVPNPVLVDLAGMVKYEPTGSGLRALLRRAYR